LLCVCVRVCVCVRMYMRICCVVQDKTFGLKNKKGKKQQEYIKHVTQQVKYGNQSMAKVAQAEMLSKVMQTGRQTDRQTDRQT